MAARRQAADSPGDLIFGGGTAGAAGANTGSKGKGKTTFTTIDDGSGPLYVGVEQGSDLELQGTRADKLKKFGVQGQSFLGKPAGPKYKTGYLNSDEFKRHLGGKDPDVVEFYQQRLAAAGLLESYSPGQLDKATRAAFKDLVTTANQSGKSWQESLQELEAMGGEVGAGREREPFVAALDDPVALRETFQKSVQEIYGGDLPDAEVDAMVSAYRSQQLAKQEAYYNTQETGGIVENPESLTPTAFAVAEVKAKHPQQLDRVKFADTFGSIMDTFKGGAQ